jgi:hypothetical protein
LLLDYLEDAWLIRCTKEDGRSFFKRYRVHPKESMFRELSLEEAFEEEYTSASRRILRGDFE